MHPTGTMMYCAFVIIQDFGTEDALLNAAGICGAEKSVSALPHDVSDRAQQISGSELLICVWKSVPRPQLHHGFWLIPHTTIWEQRKSELSKCRLNELCCKCTVHRWNALELNFPLMYGTCTADEICFCKSEIMTKAQYARQKGTSRTFFGCSYPTFGPRSAAGVYTLSMTLSGCVQSTALHPAAHRTGLWRAQN